MVQRGKTRMLTTTGVARMLHVHVNTVRRWSNSGVLNPYRIGPRGDRRFMREDVMDFLTQQRNGNGSATSPAGQYVTAGHQR